MNDDQIWPQPFALLATFFILWKIWRSPSTRATMPIRSEAALNATPTSCVLLVVRWISCRQTPRLYGSSQFWHSGDLRGLADYSNGNFVSQGTNFRGASLNPLPAERYPRPDPAEAVLHSIPIDDAELSKSCPGKPIPPRYTDFSISSTRLWLTALPEQPHATRARPHFPFTIRTLNITVEAGYFRSIVSTSARPKSSSYREPQVCRSPSTSHFAETSR